MDLTLQFSAIPAILVVAGGLLLVVGTPQNAGRRLLLYFLGVLAVTGLLVLLVTLLPVLTNNRPFINFGELIAPVAVGVLALVILHLGQVRGLTRRQLVLAAAFLLVLIGVTVILWNQASILIVLGLALGVVTLWAGGLRFRWLLWGLCLVTLVSLVSYNDPVFSMIYSPLNNRTVTPLVYAFGLMNFAYPGLAVILAAVMIQLALKPAPEPVLLPEKPLPETAETPEEPLPQPTAGSLAPRRGLWRGLQVGLAVFLLAGLAYTTFWNSVWDDTSDGLGGLALMMLGTVVAVAAGMLMMVKSASWRRLAGLLFLVLVPVLLVQSFNHGWQVSYHAITEARAASIVSALERYHARTGAYPSRLADLTPRDLLVVLPPVVMRGQPWCYQGTASAYRLEAVYRETWGIPLKIKVYASAGEPLATDPACTAQLAALKTIYDAHFSEPQIPTPEPRQPLSVVPVPRQSLSTVVTGANLMPGAWSPDGRYLAFSRDSQLEFLDVNQGKECTSGVGLYGDADPHGTTAWLPDGRLLAVTTAGDLELATPCGSYEPLPGGGETTFSQVVASDPASGRILLKTDNAFWIMDGTLSS